MGTQIITTALWLVAACWLSDATAQQQAAGHVRAASAAENTRSSHPAEHCSYMQYRAGKCAQQKPPTPINFWDLLLLNPAGKKDDQRPPATECTQAPTNPTNGGYSNCSTPATQGATCEATCEPGFTAETITATCGVDGEWSYSNNNVCTRVGGCSSVSCPGTGSFAALPVVNVTAFPLWPRATITFDEVPLGTTNPVYPPSLYGFGTNSAAPNVSFGSYFVGQDLANLDLSRLSAPLTLQSAQSVTGNVSFANGVVLSGNPSSLGPIALLLSHPVAAIGVDVKFSNTLKLKPWNVDGQSGFNLGITKQEEGFIGFVDRDGLARIRGLIVQCAEGQPCAIESVTFTVSPFDPALCCA